ncbi:hypothetical protein GE253_11505 [Niveispirillum sp. SYP-B3756]|uniref:hypothetical protein n=1 Tax=Niveispirillum sp. SYP-B3756 TaxID=2662178 RepID=UPI001291146E|nr:hypothetical protein [Niveispirillum sp. SYP-B3756]MQP65966.1 hypothetical protein [Niveispirillum sp. SYP-B3756]
MGYQLLQIALPCASGVLFGVPCDAARRFMKFLRFLPIFLLPMNLRFRYISGVVISFSKKLERTLKVCGDDLPEFCSHC